MTDVNRHLLMRYRKKAVFIGSSQCRRLLDAAYRNKELQPQIYELVQSQVLIPLGKGRGLFIFFGESTFEYLALSAFNSLRYD